MHGESPLHQVREYRPSSGAFTKEPQSLDFTQRIERKLAQYNASENVFKRWLFEIICWSISALCMIAIVLIYVRIKDEPVSSKGWFLTGTNVLGKVSSAALIVPTTEALGQLKWNWFHNSQVMWDFEIFDKASRGPWGALMLLFRTRGRSLAALGALLIVLLLGIDAFFQQIVDLPDRWRLESAAAIAPKTIFYSPNRLEEYRDGFLVSQDDPDTFHIIEKFSYSNGTQPVPYGNGTRPDIPISCPTSNCTWPVYDTLGVCSQCADVSSYLTYSCLTHTADWMANLNGLFDLKTPYPNTTMCGYFLNATGSNPILMSGYLLDQNTSKVGETLIMRNFPLTDIITKVPMYGNGSILFKELRNTIADVLVVSAKDGSPTSVHRNETPIAQECVLSWCVKRIQSAYNSGAYSEDITKTFFNTTPGPFPWEAFPYSDETGNGSDIYYLQNISIKASSPDQKLDLEYGTRNATVNSIIQGFIDIFPAYSTSMNESAPSIFRYKTWSAGSAWNQQLEFNPWLAPNNVSMHMDRLATALTNMMRSVPGKEDVKGLAFSKETFISVRWEWLTFPLVLLVLTLIFLVSTIIKTSNSTGASVWKTSAMPTLIYSLPKESQSQFTPSSTWKSSQETKKTRIRLLPNIGWRLSGHSMSTSLVTPLPQSRAPRGWV